MPDAPEPAIVVVRHGETEWSQNGRHTSVTDLPLLDVGRDRAASLRGVLDPDVFTQVLVSPRMRARETAALAGFGERAQTCEELAEWDYGDYEGLTSAEIHARRPDWSLWRDGCPGGEAPAQVTARVDRVIALAVESGGDVICFAHGHVLRSLAARWAGQEIGFGERLALAPGTVSRLGHEHATRVIERWNS